MCSSAVRSAPARPRAASSRRWRRPRSRSRGAEAQDHRCVAGAVARRVREADAAVAEEVEGAPEGRVRVDGIALEGDGRGSRRRSRSATGGSRGGSGRQPVVAASHSVAVTTKGAPGNSIPDAWSKCRWVITTTLMSAGLEAARAKLRGDVLARPEAECRPAEAPEVVAAGPRRPRGEGRCRRGSFRRSGGGSGRRGRATPRYSGAGPTPDRLQRLEAATPARSKNEAGPAPRPGFSGSTTTVALSRRPRGALRVALAPRGPSRRSVIRRRRRAGCGRAADILSAQWRTQLAHLRPRLA